MERDQMNTIIGFTTSSTSPTNTTFVQADTNTFKDLVQKLTGFSGDSKNLPETLPARLSSTGPGRSPSKFQERRHGTNKLAIKLGPCPSTTRRNSPSPSSSISPRQARRFDSPVPSPVTPTGSVSPFFLSPGTEAPSTPEVSEEEKAILEKGFYLYPSPLSTPGGTTDPPELLTLFPLSSPNQTED